MQLRKLTNGTPYGSRTPVDEGMLSRISRHPYTLPVGILAAVVGGYYYVVSHILLPARDDGMLI
jgi:ABC-type enterobactin transport system permease subunit